MLYVSDDLAHAYVDGVTCIHYGVKPRKVTKKEMLGNILQAYREVSHHYPHMSFRQKRKMIGTMINKMCKILLNPYYDRLKDQLKKILRST